MANCCGLCMRRDGIVRRRWRGLGSQPNRVLARALPLKLLIGDLHEHGRSKDVQEALVKQRVEGLFQLQRPESCD